MVNQIIRQANLTMLKQTKWIIEKESTHKNSIKQSQMTKSTTSIKTTRDISPVIYCPKKQNEKTSNQNNILINHKQCKNNQLLSLRQQINCRLSLHMNKKRAPILIDTQKTQKNIRNNQCLSSLRKMLTQYSPQAQNYPNKANVTIQNPLKIKKRAKQRRQFQLRQVKMIQSKRQKQQQALAQKIRKQIIGCTFKPKLTIYRK